MRRSTTLLAALAVLVITAAWWFLLISPKNNEIDDLNAQREAAVAEASTLRTQIARLKDIQENELSYVFAIGEMETSIPTTPDADAFIEDVTALAGRTGVDLSGLNLSPPTEVDLETRLPAFEIRVTTSITGEYFEVLGFLYGLESMERLVRIDSINLSPVPPEEEEETAEDGSGEETFEPRPRPSISTLQVDLTLTMFTRMDVVAADTAPDTGGDTTGSNEVDQGGESE